MVVVHLFYSLWAWQLHGPLPVALKVITEVESEVLF